MTTAGSSFFALLQLLRLPNVFTAVADVLLGVLVTQRPVESWPTVGLVVAASSLIYLAGMVLNDWFDRRIDAVERPERPIPSGRIAAGLAAGLGFGMLVLGVAAGWAAATLHGELRPGLTATALAAAVLVYDGLAKSTLVGPLVMGGCRMLNVLLGMSLAGPWLAWHYVLAGGIGLYVVGLTVFARSEAARSRRPVLAAGLVVMLGGIGLVASFPSFATKATWPSIELPNNWPLFWSLIAVLVGWRCVRAIVDPAPRHVQAAVRNGILSLILFDAGAVLAVQPQQVALGILALLIPAVLLGRWIYST
jgi:4-hydroxybenzoate polyprenyltransferase